MNPWFPDSYANSRSRFRQVAGELGAQLVSYPVSVSSEPELTIDVAQIGVPDQPTVVISSGLHGVECPVGAAVQLAWMAAQLQHRTNGRVVLLHSLNPYGFACGRRVNEDNVDLNRNFLAANRYSSARHESGSQDYARFNSLLNPAHPPARVDGFLLQALRYLAREGKSRLQGAIVTGQYEYARGLFYGGNEQSSTLQLIQENMHEWIGDAPEICHLDFHTGLGPFSQCQLLIQSSPQSSEYAWYEQAFGDRELVPTETADSHAYQANGAMGNWLIQQFSDRPYRFLTAEFGTYSPLKVLGALRAENQAFHFTEPGSKDRNRTRRQLEERFCPTSMRWRRTVVERGLSLIEQAGAALDTNLI